VDRENNDKNKNGYQHQTRGALGTFTTSSRMGHRNLSNVT